MFIIIIQTIPTLYLVISIIFRHLQLLGLLKAYRQEARWFHSGYKPSMEEYMQNGVHSIAGPLMTFFQFVSSPDPIVIQEHEYLKTDPHLVKCLSSIGRLQNDLGTSSVQHIYHFIFK